MIKRNNRRARSEMNGLETCARTNLIEGRVFSEALNSFMSTWIFNYGSS